MNAPETTEIQTSSLSDQLAAMRQALAGSATTRRIIWASAAILVVIVATSFGQILLNRWNQPFYDALQRRDLPEFLHQLVVFSGIAGGLLARAAPDGYTLGLAAIRSLAISPYLYAKLPFNVEKDLQAISLVGTTPNVIVANPRAPFTDLAGMVAYAKANPGKLLYATSGVGTRNHLAAELLQKRAEIALTHVPYKGSSQIVPDLISGNVMLSMESSLVTTFQHIKAGKLRAIAVTSPQRAPALPDVPTVAESGYPGFVVENWFGLIAPAAMPASMADRLAQAWAAGTQTPEVQAAVQSIHANLRSNTPQQFAQFIRAENERWSPLIRSLGLQLD